jgi:hypothetical protein
LLLALVGCEDSSAGVRRAYVDRHQSSFVYEGTTKEWVLMSVRSVIADKGFTLRDQPEPDGTYKTERVSRGKGVTGEFVVRFISLRWRQGFMVHVMYVTYDEKEKNKEYAIRSVRDEAAEWEIIQRADPDRAIGIMKEANERADRVKPRTYGRE